MRRTSKLVVLAACTSLVLVGCGRNDDTESEGEKGSSASQSVCATADGDGPKVGLAYDVGGRGDQSFNDAAYAGVEKAVEELDATCIEGEAANDESDSVREERLRNMAEQGYSPIIGVGYKYSESVNKVAPDFPEVSFAVIDGFDPDDQPNDNVAYLGFAEEQGSFLVGAAAAMKSKTGHVGFVGGVNNDLIRKFEAGFTQGAKAVNKDVKVDVAYIEESDASGFNDSAGGKAAATGILDKGADVIYHAAGGSGSGVFEAVSEAGEGNWAIGVDSDQYLTASESVRDAILTSMIKRVDVATLDAIEAVDNGEPLVSYTVYDLAADGVGYSTSGGFVDDIQGDLDELAEQIKNGDIKVKTAP